MANEPYSAFRPEEYRHLLRVVQLVINERRHDALPVILSNNLNLVLGALALAAKG